MDDEPVFNPQTLEETEWDDPMTQPAISRLDVVEDESSSPTLNHSPSSEPRQTAEYEQNIEMSDDDDESIEDESLPLDADVQAFQSMVSDAQANMAATQNPF